MPVNELTYFDVEGHWYDVEAPSTSGTTNAAQFLVVSAFVTFTPRVAPGTVVYVSNLDLGANISSPTLTAVSSATGGTFAAGAYYWVITATNANGETIKSNEVTKTLTGSASSVALSWDQVDGATGYKVYRGASAGGEDKLITTLSSGSVLTYTDTGTVGTTATPPSSNTAVNSANTAVAIAPVTARILQGELQTINTEDSPGLKLLANSAVLGLSSLIYDVSFSNVVYASAGRSLTNFAFTAPTTATVVDLTDPALTRLPYNPSGY
jgi:hypothetical protein